MPFFLPLVIPDRNTALPLCATMFQPPRGHLCASDVFDSVLSSVTQYVNPEKLFWLYYDVRALCVLACTSTQVVHFRYYGELMLGALISGVVSVLFVDSSGSVSVVDVGVLLLTTVFPSLRWKERQWRLLLLLSLLL